MVGLMAMLTVTRTGTPMPTLCSIASQERWRVSREGSWLLESYPGQKGRLGPGFQQSKAEERPISPHERSCSPQQTLRVGVV